MIPDEEPSHRLGKGPAEHEPRIKKSRMHAKDHYEREENDSGSEGYQASHEKIHDRYQPSSERSRSLTMKGLKENSEETGDNASTNETNFERLKRRIEEVELCQKIWPLISEKLSLCSRLRC